MEPTGATATPSSLKFRIRIPRAGTSDKLRNLRDRWLEKKIRELMSPRGGGVIVHLDVIAGYIECPVSRRTLQWSLQYFGASTGSWLWVSAGSAGYVTTEEVEWMIKEFKWKVWDTDMSMGRRNIRYLVTNKDAKLIKERK